MGSSHSSSRHGSAGAADSAPRICISGNDQAGKTTLLYAALSGGTVRTVDEAGHPLGFRSETLTLQAAAASSSSGGRPKGKQRNLVDRLTVIDVGDSGGAGRGAGAIQEAAIECDALLHCIRASDARLYSSLMELYLLVRSMDAAVPVIVVVLDDDDQGDEYGDIGQSFSAACSLSVRSMLPPQRSSEWVAERYRRKYVDTDWQHVAKEAKTKSHGFVVKPPSRGEFPSLASLHHGPWMVLALPYLKKAKGTPEGQPDEALRAQAMQPFRWIADALRKRPPNKAYNVVVTRDS